jgi:hypothetical protein
VDFFRPENPTASDGYCSTFSWSMFVVCVVSEQASCVLFFLPHNFLGPFHCIMKKEGAGKHRAISECNEQSSGRAVSRINCTKVEGRARAACWKHRITPSHCAPIVSRLRRHSTRAGMFTSRAQKADRAVTANGDRFLLKVQHGNKSTFGTGGDCILC